MEHKDLVLGILEDAYLLALGISDSNGPWVSSVTFVHDDDVNLYWLSEESARHSKAVLIHPKMAGSIVADYSKRNERALQIAGTVEKIEGALFEQEKMLRTKEESELPKFPGETTGNRSWYKLTPSEIELIHTERFGWNRQRVL